MMICPNDIFAINTNFTTTDYAETSDTQRQNTNRVIIMIFVITKKRTMNVSKEADPVGLS